MGWDAFGLPAENAAIQGKSHPREFTESAIKSMKTAMQRLGLSYDWTRELNTSSSEYIKAQQILFLQFYKRGLVYRSKSYVNWCPQCTTVLANEQAVDGKCWRCSSEVVKKRLAQWFLDIRRYADELLDNIHQLTGWPDSVKNIQRAWIGKSSGTEISFPIEGEGQEARVFTTRPDTIFGVVCLLLAPEHELLETLEMEPEFREAVQAFQKRILSQTAEERISGVKKSGVFTGRYAIHPLTGERVPIWVANYVLMEYGTGAVMCVPAHDERDWEFAYEYQLSIREVIAPEQSGGKPLSAPFIGSGVLVNSGSFTGTSSESAMVDITAALSAKNCGGPSVQYRLQNWSISRQRYWGSPIPIVYCENGHVEPVPPEQLPVLLPAEIDFAGSGSPLSRSAAFVNTTCPLCHAPAQRETDTMDTFVDSSWYYLRFPDPTNALPFDSATVNRMLPVDTYIGGVEHATLHLMYSRFITKVLRDLGMLAFDEPFVRLYNHGMVNDVHGRKQSKSAGNVVEPSAVIQTYGADALRLYLLFATSYNAPIDWQDDGPRDAASYLNRVWRLTEMLKLDLVEHRSSVLDKDLCLSGPERDLRRTVHETIRKVSVDVEHFRFNTAIAALMTLTNELYGYPANAARQPATAAFRVLIRMLAIFAPHFSEELWEKVGDGEMLACQKWPEFEEDALTSAKKEIVIQVNGKLAGVVLISSDATEDEIVEMALANPSIKSRLQNREIRKKIHVPNRLVNVITI